MRCRADICLDACAGVVVQDENDLLFGVALFAELYPVYDPVDNLP